MISKWTSKGVVLGCYQIWIGHGMFHTYHGQAPLANMATDLWWNIFKGNVMETIVQGNCNDKDEQAGFEIKSCSGNVESTNLKQPNLEK